MTLEEALDQADDALCEFAHDEEAKATLARWKPFILKAQVAWASRLAIGDGVTMGKPAPEVLAMNQAFFEAADEAYLRAAVSKEEKPE